MNRLKNIVVGIDFTSNCESALEQAIRIARWNNASLHVVHVIDELVVEDYQEAYGGSAEQIGQEICGAAEKRLEELLSRHEVYLRLSDMIHVRESIPGRSRDTTITRFGGLHLPALVIVRTDGKHDILELPMSYEAIVRFSEDALAPGKRHGVSATASPVVPGGRISKP